VRRRGKAQGISCATAHASPESPPPLGPVRLPRTLASKGQLSKLPRPEPFLRFVRNWRIAAVDRAFASGLGRVKMFRPRETGDAKLNFRNCELESTWFARSAVSDLVAPMRTPHVWIAAISGFTPRMFMTRVRLPPDKDINHSNRIILANPIFQAFRKQRALPAIHPLNKALHLIPRITRGNHNPRINSTPAFLHMG
jgi:hypothetical protein